MQVCRWQRQWYVVLRSRCALGAREVAGRLLGAAAVAVCLLWYGVAGAWRVLVGTTGTSSGTHGQEQARCEQVVWQRLAAAHVLASFSEQ